MYARKVQSTRQENAHKGNKEQGKKEWKEGSKEVVKTVRRKSRKELGVCACKKKVARN